MKKKEIKPRDEWIRDSWRYNGAGIQKPEKGKGSYDRKREKEKDRKDEDYPRYR